jgi:S1-C subfamily serine protease
MILGALVMATGFAFMTGCGTFPIVNSDFCSAAPMPIYQSPDLPPTIVSTSSPEAHREAAVRKWLSPSMRIRNGGSGSGTICYYDKEKNIAYVISCSHLFRSESEKQVTLEFFYKNEEKLPEVRKYTGDVVAAKINGYADDISIIKFTPDWHPSYFPIGKDNYKYEPGKKLYSVGCDSAGEVAAYFVKVIGLERSFLATRENSPRPGRSGGGLITEDGSYVGICVRTSDVTGNGVGYFVHLNTIHAFCKANKLDFLLNVDPIQRHHFLLTSPVEARPPMP